MKTFKAWNKKLKRYITIGFLKENIITITAKSLKNIVIDKMIIS